METCSHLLEIRKIMDKCLVCDIQVQDITLSATGLQIQTNKWLHLEDWLEIDAAIERLIEPYIQSETLDGFESNNFHLGGAIRIDCKKTKISKSQKRILGEDRKYLPIALDIQVTKINTIALMEQITKFEEKLSQCNTNGGMISPENEDTKTVAKKENWREYDPTADNANCDQNSKDYVPYRASTKIPLDPDTSGSVISEPYSPKPITGDLDSPDQISESPNQVPNYKPARIAKTKSNDTELTENNNLKLRSSRRRHSPEPKPKSKSKEGAHASSKRTALHNNKPTRNAELFGSDDSDQELKTPSKSSSSKPNHMATPAPIPLQSDKDSKRKRVKLRHESSSSKNSLDCWLSKGTLKSSSTTSTSSEKIVEKSSSKKSSRHESSKSYIPKDDKQRSESEAKQLEELNAIKDALKARRKTPPPEGLEIL